MLLHKHGSFTNTSLITISQKTQVAIGKNPTGHEEKNVQCENGQLLEQVAEGSFWVC